MRLELLHGLGRVVDESETSGLATTEVGAQTEDVDLLGGSLVQAGELLAEGGLGDAGLARVEDVTENSRLAVVSGVEGNRENLHHHLLLHTQNSLAFATAHIGTANILYPAEGCG